MVTPLEARRHRSRPALRDSQLGRSRPKPQSIPAATSVGGFVGPHHLGTRRSADMVPRAALPFALARKERSHYLLREHGVDSKKRAVSVAIRTTATRFWML